MSRRVRFFSVMPVDMRPIGITSSSGDNLDDMPDKMTKKARKLTRKGWTFRFAKTKQEKGKAAELFRMVDGVTNDAMFDGDILVAESPHHSIAGAALLGAWEDANGLRHCLVRVLAVAPDKQGKGVGTALLWATHAAARGIEVFGGCSAANEGFYRAAGCEIRTDLGNGMVSSNPLYNRWFVLP